LIGKITPPSTRPFPSPERAVGLAVAEHRKIRFVLKVAGVCRVSAIGLRRSIGVEAAQICIRRRIEQRKIALVRRRIVGERRDRQRRQQQSEKAHSSMAAVAIAVQKQR
jgi:hypothetical protein